MSKNAQGVLILLVGVGMICLFIGMAFGPTRVELRPGPVETKTVYDIKTVTKTVETERPFSFECKRFLEATYKLRDAQRILSKTKGDMEMMVKRITAQVGNQDPTEVVQMKKEMIVLTDTMDNAWHDIGEASATIDKYTATDNPC